MLQTVRYVVENASFTGNNIFKLLRYAFSGFYFSRFKNFETTVNSASDGKVKPIFSNGSNVFLSVFESNSLRSAKPIKISLLW